MYRIASKSLDFILESTILRFFSTKHICKIYFSNSKIPRKSNEDVEISCIPLHSIIDQKVRVNIRGLIPHQLVSLRARICGESRDRYHSLAHYVADNQGQVCLSSQPSVGGSYTGVEPMGFMWALRQEPGQKPGRRLMKRDVTTPYLVDLDVLDKHVEANTDETPLCSLTIERHYMGSGVKRYEVRAGRIRGSLFLPAGDGPFPGVIELVGSHGGLVEYKAALLATNGFAAMSLAYLNYDDLPKSMEELELEYFLEAVDWLKNHPHVITGGVGVMGISKGADIALLVAANCHDVAAAVCVSGSNGLFGWPIKYKSQSLEYFEYMPSEAVVYKDGSVGMNNCFPDTYRASKGTPVENIKGRLLLVYGTDDQSLNTELYASKIYNRMKIFGRETQCSMLGYHGAGHVIEPPYSPHCNASYQKSMNVVFSWGGKTQQHALAQEHFWPKALTFLNSNLPAD